MYDVVSDVERYQEFLPWCQKSLVKTRRKTYVIADLVVGFPPLVYIHIMLNIFRRVKVKFVNSFISTCFIFHLVGILYF